jgi:hypothetical protein
MPIRLATKRAGAAVAVIVILILGLVAGVLGLIAWRPTDTEAHQPHLMHDGSRVALASGRRLGGRWR